MQWSEYPDSWADLHRVPGWSHPSCNNTTTTNDIDNNTYSQCTYIMMIIPISYTHNILRVPGRSHPSRYGEWLADSRNNILVFLTWLQKVSALSFTSLLLPPFSTPFARDSPFKGFPCITNGFPFTKGFPFMRDLYYKGISLYKGFRFPFTINGSPRRWF